MTNPQISLLKLVVWSVFLSYFCTVAMPQYEPGQVSSSNGFANEEAQAVILDNSELPNKNGEGQLSLSSQEISSGPTSLEDNVISPVPLEELTNNNGSDTTASTTLAIDPNPTAFLGETASSPEPTSAVPTTAAAVASEAEILPLSPSNDDFSQENQPKTNIPSTTPPFSGPAYLPTEISSPPTAPTTNGEQEQPEIEEDPLLPLPSSSTPLLQPPVVDPITYSQQQKPSAFFGSVLPFIREGANNPSIQLIPPSPSTNPVVPEEPSSGQVPESPEPQQPHHPYNLRDIPITLLSLSGNSGGSTSDMATFSSLASATENVPVDFTRFRYHVVTGQLFKIGSTGPGICPLNMRFFAVPGHPKNGACDCDYYQCSRPLIYSNDEHKCFWAWSQGPCEKGEWWVFDKDLKRRGKCEKNPCPNSAKSTSGSNSNQNDTTEYYFQNPQDEACYQEGTKGYCKDEDERLLIYPGEPVPKCRKFTVCYPLTVPQELQCIYGNKYFVESGQCQ